jgi:site-specific DNA recombinase
MTVSAAAVVSEDLLERVRDVLASQGAAPTAARVAMALRSHGLVHGDAEVLAVVDALRRDTVGAGPLDPLLRLPGVTDVLVNGPSRVYLDRGHGLESASVSFPDDASVRRLAQRLASAGGRRLDDATPFVDVRLADGTRFHAVLSPLAKPGTCLSLRVPAQRAFTLEQLVAAGSMSGSAAAMLDHIVAGEVAFLVSGGTGTGKTTPWLWHHYTMSLPERAIVLARISDARNGDTAGVNNQIDDGRKLAERLGWTVGPVETHLIVENDTSAFKRRKIKLPDGRHVLRTVRPGFRRGLDMLATGKADGLIALDLDRTCRDPRDLEDLIDIVESAAPRIPVESVTGSLRLLNDADVTMARVMVAVANKSSRDKGRRVARARLRNAQEGAYNGGRRPYGWEADGVTLRPSEAAEVVNAAEAILAGVSLNQIAADLRSRGVLTVTGAEWTAPTVRDILLKPRNAGLVVYQGEILGGVTAEWPPILDRERWEVVRHILTDQNRRTTPGNTPRWLGSGLYRCGHPDCIGLDPNPSVRSSRSGPDRHPTYRCRRVNHLGRRAEWVDNLVERVIVARLSRPDAAELLAPSEPGADLADLSREAQVLRARIVEATDLWESGVISPAELKIRRGRLAEKLTEAETRIADMSGMSPLKDLAGTPDPGTVWDGLDLGRKRAALDILAVVTLLPARPGRRPDGSYFDPDTVKIEWRS